MKLDLIRKKNLLQGYFQIKYNSKYDHSFAERLKVIGLNGFILLSGLGTF